MLLWSSYNCLIAPGCKHWLAFCINFTAKTEDIMWLQLIVVKPIRNESYNAQKSLGHWLPRAVSTESQNLLEPPANHHSVLSAPDWHITCQHCWHSKT